MSEEVNNGDILKLDKERKVRVLLDTTPQVVSKDAEIARLNQELGKMQETNKILLEEQHKNFTEQKHIETPPEGTTARLNEEHEGQRIFTVSSEGSYIEPSWVKSSSHEENIAIVQHLAKVAENKEDFQKIESRLLKKVIKGNKPFDMTFLGSSKDFMKSPLPVTDDLPIAEQERRRKKNDYLKANRCSWKNNSED